MPAPATAICTEYVGSLGSIRSTFRPKMTAWADGAAESATGDKAVSRVARYQRLGDKTQTQLGKGTYGVVYVAWDSKEAHLVAIKEQHRKSPDAFTEMCVMQTVGNHQRLVELLDVCVVDDKCMLILEYLPSSLADVFTRARGFLDWDLCYRYGRQVLEAVDFLHTQGVVHRDISLNNILVDGRNNAVKLADFGMAASASNFIFDRTVTALSYRAPEAILKAAVPDGQTPLDMWSLGTVWACLWSATNVFPGKSLQGVFRMQAQVLGGTPVAQWPECRAAPKWGDVEDALLAEFPYCGPREYLLSSEVRRPLHGHENLIDILCKVLMWRPSMRLSACDALGHPAWQHVPPQPEPQRKTPERTATVAPAVPPEGTLCNCRGHCGRKECNRRKARIQYLKKMNRDVPHEESIICDGHAVLFDSQGRCCKCHEACPTPTPQAFQKASDANKRKLKRHGKRKATGKRCTKGSKKRF